MGAEGFDDYPQLRQRSRVYRDGFKRRSATVIRLVREGRGPAAPAAFRLLDVGTADGIMLRAFADAFPGSQRVGIEASAELVAVARADGHEVVEARAEALPFPDACFEVATVVATLKHVPEADRALAELHRVLVPGGVLVVADPTPWGLRLGLWRGHFDPRWLAHRWSLAATRHHAQEAGFTVRRGVRYMPLPIDLPGTCVLEALGRLPGVSRLFLQQATLAIA
jgi:SAM-dependent methyltransferase